MTPQVSASALGRSWVSTVMALISSAGDRARLFEGRSAVRQADTARRSSARRLAAQLVEVLADVGGLRGGVGERDGLVERLARLGGAAELLQQRALGAEVVEIAAERTLQRRDHGERRLRPADLGDRHG